MSKKYGKYINQKGRLRGMRDLLFFFGSFKQLTANRIEATAGVGDCSSYARIRR